MMQEERGRRSRKFEQRPGSLNMLSIGRDTLGEDAVQGQKRLKGLP